MVEWLVSDHGCASRPCDSDNEEGAAAPWAEELETAILTVGGSAFTGFDAPWFTEVAWYHRKSRTLLVTDAVLQVRGQEHGLVSPNHHPALCLACAGHGVPCRCLVRHIVSAIYRNDSCAEAQSHPTGAFGPSARL